MYHESSSFERHLFRTDAFLDEMRHIGDPEADDVVRRVFEQREFGDLSGFVGSLSGTSDLPVNLPPEIRAFVDRTSSRPDWVHDMHLRRAEHFFLRHGLGAMVSLVCASLPECYTMRKGVRILALTRQLGAHTDRRLHQTALMLLAVMQPHGLDRGGFGIIQSQRVRLLHAAIRRLVRLGAMTAHASLRDGARVNVQASASIGDAMARAGFRWNLEADGEPLNQEDLAFTLLTFGYVLPLGMSRFGVPVSHDEQTAFIHTWNVVGAYLGVRRELMADTPEDAAFLFARIKQRQAGPTADGAFLTGRLLAFLERDVLRVRPLAPLAPVLVRSLVGDETARMLGLDVRDRAGLVLFHQILARLVTGLNRVGGVLGRFHPLRRLGSALGRRTVEFLYRYTSERGGAPLAIPVEWSGVKFN